MSSCRSVRGASLTLIESHDSAEGAAHLAQALDRVRSGRGRKRQSCARQRAGGAKPRPVSTLGVDIGAHAEVRDILAHHGRGSSRAIRCSCASPASTRMQPSAARRSRAGASTRTRRSSSRHVGGALREPQDIKIRGGRRGDRRVPGQGGRRPPARRRPTGSMKWRALLLRDGATMNNKPELEIFADDVVCGHGATVAARRGPAILSQGARPSAGRGRGAAA